MKMEGVVEETTKGGERSDRAQFRQNVGPPASLSAASRQAISNATLTLQPHPSDPYLSITRRDSKIYSAVKRLANMAATVDQKLLRATRFPPEFNQKVDMNKVNLEVIKGCVDSPITAAAQHC